MEQVKLDAWRDFFVMIGTAAGVIVGAAFVVASLTSGQEKRELGLRGFITPTAVHLGGVLIGSAVLVVPLMTPFLYAVIFGIFGAAGVIYALVIVVRIRSLTLDLADWCWYAIAPVLAYLGMAWSAWTALHSAETSLEILSVVLVSLLVIGMHNLWDMATFMILRAPGSP